MANMVNMFNNVATMSDGATPQAVKLSAAKSIGFRPGPALRAEVDDLLNSTNWTTTDIARVGLQAFWQDIKAIVKATPGKAPKKQEEIQELREFIELCRTAKARGVDPKLALTAAMEAKLAEEAVVQVA